MTEKEQKLLERILAVLARHTKRLDKLEEVVQSQQQVLHQMKTALESHHSTIEALAALRPETHASDPGSLN